MKERIEIIRRDGEMLMLEAESDIGLLNVWKSVNYVESRTNMELCEKYEDCETMGVYRL